MTQKSESAAAGGRVPTRRGHGSNRKVVWGALGVVVVVGIAVGLVVGLGGSSSSGGSGGASESVAGSGSGKLTAEALQLRTLLAKGARATYHAKYTLTSSDPTQVAGSAAIEVWHRPPLERQDTVLTAPNTPPQNQMELRLTGGLLTCTQSAQGQWTCSKYTTALPSGPEAIVDQITSSLRSETVTGRSATVAGNAAECYDVATKKSALSLCLSRQGVPLEVTDGALTLAITTLDHTAEQSVFTPPAPVGSATSTTS